MNKNFDFKLEPGRKLNKEYYDTKHEPIVSIIIPFYYDKDYIEHSVNCILNQTFPCYEILIIDDGTKDEEHLKKLSEIEKLDERIKVFHKENEGLSATRDYGAKQACKSSKYLMFIDSDDFVEPTYIECCYWTLETNKEASWVYTDSIGFEGQEYLWNKWFDSDRMKKQNDLVSTAFVTKEAFETVGGYGLREKAVNEDWNFWLKLLAKGKVPVHISFYGIWYRRKKSGGELKRATDNKKRALEIINETAQTITKRVEAIQYPHFNYNYDLMPDKLENIIELKQKDNGKINILMIVPWLVVGGADKFNLDLVKGLDKEKYSITILTTEPNENILRQEIEKYCTVYDLNSFIDKKYWLSFINYIIEKNNINLIFNTNSKFGYSILPYLKQRYNFPILDYIHMEEWYFRNGGYARYSAGVSSAIDKTLTCNQKTNDILNNHFNVPKEKIETVYIGVDADKYNPDKFNENEILSEYNIDKKDKKLISFICRISEQKRPFLLLEIIEKIKEKRSDLLFLVVGNGNLLEQMKQKAKEKNIEDCIKFLDYIKETEKIYKISDITINCSLKEGVALTSYESLSMGVPVISSDVGGQKELIDSKVGVIVPCLQKENDIYISEYPEKETNSYVEAIEKILNNLSYYKQNCRKRILDNFTIQTMVHKMSNIFEKAMSDSTRIKEEQNTNIAKELITIATMNDKTEYEWECLEYERKVYGKSYSNATVSYKRELIKEKLWTYPVWRGAIKVYHRLIGRKD